MQTITLAMSVDDIIGKVQNAVWGWPLIILILAAGVWLTVRTGFVQVRHLGKALKFMVKNEDNGEGEVLPSARCARPCPPPLVPAIS